MGPFLMLIAEENNKKWRVMSPREENKLHCNI